MGQKQQTRAEHFTVNMDGVDRQIFVTNEHVVASDSDSLVPKGHRKITPEEGTIAWNTNEEFRNNLTENYGVWTSQKGLNSAKEQKINPDGSFSKITESEYDKLEPKDRSYHYSGDGLVALDGGYDGRYWGLDVYADFGTVYRLRVAYVLGEAEPQKSVADTSSKLRKQAAEKELDSLSKLVNPELIKAITEYIRKG